MTGFIKLHREFLEHWLYKSEEPFTEREAWIDILMNVNWEDKKVRLGNNFIVCKAGQCCFSQITWAKRWRWNRSRAQRFINLLEKDGMIVTKVSHNTSILTVCNWALYQEKRAANEQKMSRKRAASEQQVSTTKEYKEDKEVYNTHTGEKSFSNFPGEDFLEIELPEIKMGAAIQLFKFGKGVDATEEKILGFWEIFKKQNFTGKKFYQTENDIHSHFLNWLNTKNIQNVNGNNKTARERQNAASAAVTDDLNKAIEFINGRKSDNAA